MATLAVDYNEIRTVVGDYLGITRNTEGAGSEWTTDEIARIDDVIKTGLTKVYYPQSGYEWSFLTPVGELTTTAPYETGTIAIASGVVTLTGGTFPTWAADGDLVVGSNTYTVDTRDSATQLTLNDLTATATAGSTYELQRYLYEMDADFAGFRDSAITFVQGEAELYPSIEVKPDVVLRGYRQQIRINETEWATPRYASLRPKSYDATTGTC